MKNNYSFLKYIYIKFKSVLFNISYYFNRPKYPNNKNNEIYLHLGCGEINSKEFINIDSRAFPHIHHKRDVKDLSIFPDNFANMIYASHVLEHLPMVEIKKVLLEWKRVLKSDGILRLSVPDFDKIIIIYYKTGNSIKNIWPSLMGGQEYDSNFHFSVFNSKYLKEILLEVGFKEVREWDYRKVELYKFEDWASMLLEIEGKKFPISLNLEAIK